MEFGFTLPNSGPLASPENLAILARRGEEMGFDVIGVGDHIVMPKSISSRYPYSESGDFPAGGECLEQPTLLSFVASHTSTARPLTSVMVLPYRSPVFVAKMLATIDVLSRGRLIVGVGVGWMREEFGALGSPPYDERGAVGDEYINAFKELWTSDDPAFEGKYCSFRGISFAPKPVQKPHPPIWVGGESPFGWDANLDRGKPRVVGSWDVTSDGLNWTFTIRPGLTFHNGSPLTTDDVVQSLERWWEKTSGGLADEALYGRGRTGQAVRYHVGNALRRGLRSGAGAPRYY